ncbi:nuclear transport factor 2 family protein [Metabacillus sp. KIGAM252]|uniref:Nuclear transport factor 2 family protein n=1 Tax=Metabacillus flavus TaxID=2823519 RepID=A0ABS5LAX2_9BACI|nr:nuclear transport factor 2 family protein [Metabacillus flavus]MBS2967683.1 nuclear transport factor 2 family protein [Metabacillus flavus]
MKRIAPALILFLFMIGGCGMPAREAVQPVNPSLSLKPKEPVLIKEDSLQKTSGNSARKPVLSERRLSKEDEKQILAVLNDYFDALKRKDLDRYMDTISKTAQIYNYEMKRLKASALFEQPFSYNLTFKEARVYKSGKDLRTAAAYASYEFSMPETKETATVETVIVFKKDPEGWKVSAAVGLPITLKR